MELERLAFWLCSEGGQRGRPLASGPRRTSDGAAVVHDEDLAVDAFGLIGGEEQEGIGLVVGAGLGDGGAKAVYKYILN